MQKPFYNGSCEYGINWPNFFILAGYAASLVLTVFLFIAMFKSHDVNYYYFSAGTGSVTCANAHKTWSTDSTAYCSDDINKVVEFVKKANCTLDTNKCETPFTHGFTIFDTTTGGTITVSPLDSTGVKSGR